MPHQCTNCGRTFADGSKEMLSGCPDCAGTKFQFQPDGFGSDSDGGSDTASEESGTASEPGSPSSPPEETAVDPRDRPGDAVSRTVGSAAATVRDLVSGSAGPDATAAEPRSEAVTPDAPDPSDAGETADTTGDASDDDIIVAECEPVESEDAAQSDARSQLAEPDEVPENGGFDPSTDESIDTGVDKITFDDSADATAESTSETTVSGGTNGATESSADSTESMTADPDSAEETGDRQAVEEPDAEVADRPDLAELRDELNEQFESIRVVEPGQYELNLMELYDREEYIIALQEDGRYSIQVPETWRQADV